MGRQLAPLGALAACLTILACGPGIGIDHPTSSTTASGGAGSTTTSPGTGGLGDGSGGSGGGFTLPPTPTFGLPEAPCAPPVWAQAWEGFLIDRSAAYGPDGVVLSGWVDGAPGNTVRVLALDETGQSLWIYETASDAPASADVAADGTGNVVLAGVHRGMDFGIPTTTFPTTSSMRYFTAKLDASGAPLWVVEWGVDEAAFQQQSTGLGHVRVALDSQGHIVVAGRHGGPRQRRRERRLRVEARRRR